MTISDIFFMKRPLSRLATLMLMLMALLWQPAISTAEEKTSSFIVAPFVEYNYLADTGGAQEMFDHINRLLGGWLRGYEDFDLFQHLLLVGAEFRLARPGQWGGLEPFFSLAGSTGSTAMLNEDYDERYDLRTIPFIAGDMDPVDIPFVDITGQARLRVDQYLDYYIPMQVGLRYQARSDRPLSFFGMVSGGLLFFKGGLDIDADIDGTLASPLVNGTAEGSYRGKAEMKDTGWIMSALVGLQYHWRPDLSSSFAVGYGTGRLKDDVHISGRFAGDVSGNTLLSASAMPFLMDLAHISSVDLDLDGWRARLVFLEWQW